MNVVSLKSNTRVKDVEILITVDYLEIKNGICFYKRIVDVSGFNYHSQEQGICLKEELHSLSNSSLCGTKLNNVYLIHSYDVANVKNMPDILCLKHYKINKPFDEIRNLSFEDYVLIEVYEEDFKIVDFETKEIIFQNVKLLDLDFLTETDKNNVIINLANYIDSLDIDEDVCRKVGKNCLLTEDLSESQKKLVCQRCIINFFKQK